MINKKLDIYKKDRFYPLSEKSYYHRKDFFKEILLGAPNKEFLLDDSYSILISGCIKEGLDKLFTGLRDKWEHMSRPEWDEFSQVTCLDHPIINIIHKDPLTNRAFYKPRKYAGDALMLDYIYYPEDHMQGLDKIAKEIFAYTTDTPASQAVRARREITAKLVDEISGEKKNAKIFSLACGHMREVELSTAFKAGYIEKWIGADVDKQSLAKVNDTYGNKVVSTMRLSAMDFIYGDEVSELRKDFDFVYSVGLYDYLSQIAAKILTLRLFNILNSGGKLLIANFLPGIRDIGYMEAFMDWKLVYRNKNAMVNLASAIPKEQIAGIKTFSGGNDNLIFLEVQKV